MAAKIGKFQIELELETGKLVSQIEISKKKIENGAKRMQKSLSSITSGLSFATVGAALGAAGLAATEFAGFLKDGALEAIAAEKAQLQLSAALGSGTGRVTAMTAALQRRTGADADAMNQQAAVLASMGLTTDQIERAIPAIRAYAEVTGKNAAGAVKSLGKAFDQGKVEQKIAALSVFIPAADAATETFGGTVERLTRNLGEFQEELGSSVIESDKLKASFEILSEQIAALTGEAEGLGPLIGDKLSEGMAVAAKAVSLFSSFVAQAIHPTELFSSALFTLLAVANPVGAALLMIGDTVFPEIRAGFVKTAEEADKFSASLDSVNSSSIETSKALDEIQGQFSVDPDFEKKASAAFRGGKKEKKKKTKKDRAEASAKPDLLGSGAELNTGGWRDVEQRLAMDEMDAALEEIKKQQEAAAKAQEDAVNASREIAGFAADTALDAVFQPLEDGFLDINKIIGGLKSAVLDLIKQMIAAAAMKAILGVATGGATTAGGGLLSVLGFASGGPVGGTGGPRADNIPAWLSSGEYVMDAATTRRYGAGFFAALQQRKLPAFAGGGLVGAAGPGAAGLGSAGVVVNIDGRGMDEDTLSRAVGRALRQAGIRGNSDLRAVLPTSPTSLLRRG